MREDFDANPGALRRREPSTRASGQPDPVFDLNARSPRPSDNGRKPPPNLDVWTVIDALTRRFHWVLLCALIGGVVFFFLGSKVIKPKFTATAKLLRYTPPGDDDFFRTAALTAETFSGLIRSPDLMRRVSTDMLELGIPFMIPERLSKAIAIEPEPDSEIVSLALASNNPTNAVNLLNLYARHAVDFTRELQREQAMKLSNDYLLQQVKEMEKDIADVTEQFRKLPANPQVASLLQNIGGNLTELGTNIASSTRPNPLLARQTERLQLALVELNDLLDKYTEIHPLVVSKQEEIRSLTNRMAQAATSTNFAAATALPISASAGTRNPDAFNPEMELIRVKLLSLEDGRVQLVNRQREANLYAANPPGIVRVFAPATLRTVQGNMRSVKIGVVSLFGAFLGMGAALCLIGLVEVTDKRLRTPEDLRRITNLPVLASLGDLQKMTPAEKSDWAFRAWTMLQGRLSPTPNHGIVCGVTSAENGDGRSTWIRLLADAASHSGYKVLTIATKSSDSPTPANKPDISTRKDERDMKPIEPSHSLTTSILSSPSSVTEQLTGPNPQPVVHIPLPGWAWNLDRRKEWREALEHWRQIENIVILVELPPAKVPEAVLLGSNLPNLIWLARSGASKAAETRTQIETLFHARCNLVGSVINKASQSSIRRLFPKWVGCLVLALGLFCTAGRAQDVSNSPTNSAPESAQGAGFAEDALDRGAAKKGRFSIVDPSQRADWQKRLTLGPGDVINLALFGAPELNRAEITIPPDGRISFLEANDILVTGLTIDEVRARLDEELGKFRRAPRTMITPLAFNSKKYFVLGKIMTKGVYTLDRPMTVLEAIARAKGLENGLVDRNVVDLADMERAFLVRGGKRFSLNFEKLFMEGDLAQNVAIEPGDYIYFPPRDLREVFVVGEVRLPGPVIFNPGLTIIGAITARGGYTERAYKTRVIVVRGSISQPEPIAVDTHGILDGRKTDFKLKPRDIIFVNSRPFIRVEEAADLAATAFIQSVVTSWVGVDVVSPIKD